MMKNDSPQISKTTDKDKNIGSYTGLEIAVIGMACRFPQADDIDAFWENLKNGFESVVYFSDDELAAAGVERELIDQPHYVKAARPIAGKEYFDSVFFGYMPAEARVMDPQTRLFHQCAWEALEDSGCNPDTYNGLIGIYAGAGSNIAWEAGMLLSGGGEQLDSFTAGQLRSRDYISSRISYKLNLKGPAVFVQTACSTSLTAIHLACRGLLTGEANIALAGGVTLANAPRSGYLYQEGMIYSPDGHCRAFAAEAQGTTAGEGAAVVVLKQLKRALADRDNIRAVIKGSAINNDGLRKVGFSAPSMDGQAEVIRMAHKMARIEPHTVGFIETHGTATPLGDVIEFDALRHVFCESKEKYCALGSVKTNVGHLDTAAGVAGFIKAVLSLQRRLIPATLFFNNPNPRIDFSNTPFFVNTRTMPWPNDDRRLRAGVSSFGIGGTNVHVVLEEAPAVETSPPARDYRLFVFSAATTTALDEMRRNLLHYFKRSTAQDGAQNPEPALAADAAYTLQTGRKAFSQRSMFVCSDISEAVQILSHPKLDKVKKYTASKKEKTVVFMFPGQGNQYVDMGLGLYRSEPIFRQEMDRCLEILRPLVDYDLKEILYPGLRSDETDRTNMSNSSNKSYKPHDFDIDRTEITHPLLFIFEYALAKLLMAWGIKPTFMIGYSFGEYTSACLSGIFSLADALSLIVSRARMMQQTPPGTMLSIPLSEAESTPLLAPYKDLSLAVVNGPSCIISGPKQAVEAFELEMKKRKLLCIRVGVGQACHSQVMAPIEAELLRILAGIKLEKPQMPYISSVTGTWITHPQAQDPHYWAHHIQATVRFAAGIEQLLNDNETIFLEIGPGRALCNFVMQQPGKKSHHIAVNLVRTRDERFPDSYYLLERLGRLWLYGLEIDWQSFYDREKRRRISLPTYPFDKIAYPVEIDVKSLLKGALSAEGKNDLPGFKTQQESAPFPEGLLNRSRRAELLTPYIEPQTPTEQTLAATWQDFFGAGMIGVIDNFFELGGDSLKAMNLTGLIHKRLDVQVSLADFFARPNIRELAKYIDVSLKKKLRSIPQVEKREYYAPSSTQKRLYFIQRFAPQDTAYNMPQFIPLPEDIDKQRLEQTIAQLIRRHESFRTYFDRAGQEIVQRIRNPQEIKFEIEYHEKFDSHLIARFVRPFDPAQAPLLRAAIIAAPGHDTARILLLDMHHIITDGMSMVILAEEFNALYAGRKLPGTAVQYKEYSQWQDSPEQKAALKKQEQYWLALFPGEIPLLDLPTDYTRPPIQSFAGDVLEFRLGKNEVERLKAVAIQSGATLYMVLLAIYNIFLARLGGQEDIIIGAPIAGRRHPDLQGIIGMFVNTLAPRNFPHGEKTFSDFLHEVKKSTTAAFENQDYSFADLVERLKIKRDTARNPLFDVVFNLLNQAEYDRQIPRILQDDPDVRQTRTARFDLTLTAMEIAGELFLSFEYCTKLFRASTIGRFIEYFNRITAQCSENPGIKIAQIDILGEEERNRLLNDFNGTRIDYPQEETMHRLFSHQAEKTPHRICLSSVSLSSARDDVPLAYMVQLTYCRLDEESAGLADELQNRGVRPGMIAALMLERSLEMITGILGVLKSGAAYLPIDPEAPPARKTYMLTDSGARFLVTRHSSFDKVESIENRHSDVVFIDECRSDSPYSTGVETIDESPRRRGSAQDPAYIIFTSGSTGKPKGVIVTHANICPLMYWGNTILAGGPAEHTLQNLSYYFDWSVWEIFITLTTGAALYIVPGEMLLNPQVCIDIIKTYEITILHVTPSQYQYIAAETKKLPSLEYLFIGAEKLTYELLERAFASVDERCRVFNMYGPTEATIISAALEIDRQSYKEFKKLSGIPIGRPTANLRLSIVDKNMRLRPVNMPGELCISGTGVAQGYLNNPELTAEKFIASGGKGAFLKNRPLHPQKTFENSCVGHFSPLTTHHSPFTDHLYKTGDMARWLPDGNIEFMGRIDQQVKIRGFRIELGEIENRLLEHKQIKEAVVIDRQNRAGDKYLCAYLVGQNISHRETKEYLAHVLPDYMIPQYVVMLDKIPLTPNGKVDRNALPEPEISNEQNYIAPRSEIERNLTAIWADVLKIDKVHIGLDSNFFELGGHSLRATMLSSRIHDEWQVKVPLAEIFSRQTIRALAGYIENGRRTGFSRIEPVEKKEYYPLSSAQKRLYFIQQMEVDSTAYNMPLALPLSGQIGKDKIEFLLRKLVARHESFRTSFIPVNDEPLQRIHDPQDITFEIECYESTGSNRVSQFIRPFDLAKAPLLRSGLIEFPDHSHLWLVDMHHIISDGTSHINLTRDFVALYKGEEAVPLRIQYKDFTQWQNDLFAGTAIKVQEEFWLDLYRDAGTLPRLPLPTDYRRPDVFTFAGAGAGFMLEREQARRFKALGGKYGVTLYMNFLAALNALLFKYTGETDIVIGCSIAGRTHVDLQPIMGMFINTLALRNQPMGEKSYESFLREVAAHCIKAFENQDLQLETLVERLDVERDTSRSPLFDICTVVQNFEPSGTLVELSGRGDELAFKAANYSNTSAKFDMTFLITERGDDIFINIEYYTAIFKEETIAGLFAHFSNLVQAVNRDPGIRLKDIEIISEQEKERVLYKFNDTYTEYPNDKTIGQLFLEQVEKYPDRVALSGFGQESGVPILHRELTYRVLYGEAQRLADRLMAKGIEPDTIVGLMLERSLEMITGILGILLAGGAYMPIEMGYPDERISYMLADSGAPLLVSRHSSFDKGRSIKNWHGRVVFLDECSGDSTRSPEPGCSSADVAYVIYTSGTTGKPKGVLTRHFNVTRVVRNTDYIEINPQDNILQLSNYAFDGSVFDIYGALLNGAKLLSTAQPDMLAVDRLGEIIKKAGITVFFVTTALFNTLVDLEISSLAGVRKVLFGGERVSLEHSRKALAGLGKNRIIHVYGPTETTVYATYYFIDEISPAAETIPIGKPLANTQAYILDGNLQPMPPGINGEIYIGGDGNARGYLNNPELTAEKFIASGGQEAFLKNRPLHPQKTFENSFADHFLPLTTHHSPFTTHLYKTGDLGRRLPDGNIEFTGRIDHQVKLRGFRIELGEIENRLLEHEKVRAAVVLDRENKNGEKYLCAYLVGKNISQSKITEYLSRLLPDYMIPQYFIMLDKIPLSPNGKVDRKALPEPEISFTEAYTAPRNEIENKLAAIWAETLNIDVEKIGIDSNFFKLGGHSLKAAVITAKIYKELGVKVPVTELFNSQTIKDLSGSIGKFTGEKFDRVEPLEKKEYYELSFNQKRLWIIQQRNREDNSYNMPNRILMEHKIDEALARETTSRLMTRHESLRIGFRETAGTVVQYVSEKYEIPFTAIDLTRETEDRKEIRLKQVLSDFELRPFNLEQPPLFRVLLIKLADERCIFAFNMHHIITDGWSMGILERDFRNIYNACSNGEAGPGTGNPITYKDFAYWRGRQSANPVIKKQSHDFWLNFLNLDLPLLRLPGVRAGMAKVKPGANFCFVIPGAVKEALKNQGGEHNITLFSFLYAIYIIFLARLSGQAVVVSSIVNAGRDHAALLDIVGFFVNAVPFRKEIDFEEVFIDFAGKVQLEVFDFFKHQNYPLELVLEEAGRKYPDIAASFNMVNVLSNENLALENMDSYHTQGTQNVKFEIEFYVSEYTSGIEINAAYNRDLFKTDDAAFIMAKYSKLVEFFALHPTKQLKDYKEGKKKKIIVKTNITKG